MQKEQLIKWMTNIIKTKILQNQDGVLYELESKLGKFKGMNYEAKQYLDSIKGMQQLEKINKKYQFESKIDQNQFNSVYNYFKVKDHMIIKRVDFSLNKQQRSSFQLQDQEISAVLIEKIKNLSQHIDIINDKIHYRISLNQEKTLSKSLKDILAQMPSRKQHANFIRLKETLFLKENNLEYALSKVSSIPKAHPQFKQILDQISDDSKLYNIKSKVENIINNQQFKEFEFEIEVSQQLQLNDEQLQDLALNLINQTEYFWNILNQKEQSQENDLQDQIQKKIKQNDE